MHVDVLKQLFPSLLKYGSRFFRVTVGGFKLPVRQVSVQPNNCLTVGPYRPVILRPKFLSLGTWCSGLTFAFVLFHFRRPELLAASVCGCLGRSVSYVTRVA